MRLWHDFCDESKDYPPRNVKGVQACFVYNCTNCTNCIQS